MTAREPTPPRPPKRPIRREAHGVAWTDDYAWMRAENWREAAADPALLPPEIRAHLEAENAYAAAATAPFADDAAALFEAMKARLDVEERTPPTPDGPWAYFSYFREGAERRSFWREPRDGGTPQLLFDADVEAGDADYFEIGGFAHSPDHSRIAYSVDRSGSELFEIRVRELADGAESAPLSDRAAGGAVWLPGGRFLAFVERDEAFRPNRVRIAEADGAGAYDLFAEPDPGWFVSVSLTRSKRYLVVDVHGHGVNEIRIARVANDRPPHTEDLVVVDARTDGVQYFLEHVGGRFFIRTNQDGAADFRIETAPDGDLAARTTIVPHRAGRMIEAVDVFETALVRIEREDAVQSCVVCDHDGRAERRPALEDAARAIGFARVLEADADAARLVYESPRTPPRFLAVDLADGSARTILERAPRGAFDGGDYEVGRLDAEAPDGARVPITVLRRRDAATRGPAPTLLYGYGAYGITNDARFSAARLALADRGFAIALAHVRGCADKARAWYEAGKLERKENSFTDFLACARALVDAGVAEPGRIAAHGGSAGGLLVSAAMAIDPQAFAAVVAEVPFVDVLNTMMDAGLPLTPPEWPEWGNPIEDAAAFERLRRYSPYDAARPGPLPHVYATAGVSDPRVTYWEPAKWVARLREVDAGGAVILLDTVMSGGHAGASGRYARMKETAKAFAFVLGMI